jgi:hypothetical protein
MKSVVDIAINMRIIGHSDSENANKLGGWYGLQYRSFSKRSNIGRNE